MAPFTPYPSVPRVLLRRLREVMAEKAPPEARLDRIVKLIASNMVAEVCSVYLLTGHGELELVATEGLNPTAVHKTRLKLGEGLIGLIGDTAEPLNLPDAQNHPKFAYRPETGEDPYKSLMGVPVLRGGQTLGVLAVQNMTRRHYTEEEVEALQTIAMVLAEIAAGGDLIDPELLAASSGPAAAPFSCKVTAMAEGIAKGHAVLHEPKVRITRLIAEDMETEAQRLDRAIAELRASVDRMLTTADRNLVGEPRDVLEAYRMFANDRGWLRRLHEAVYTGLTAEAAVERVQNDTRARMMRQRDAYLRERLHDLEDLANRLLRLLSGAPATAAAEALPEDAVIFARNMGPAELLDYDASRLRGVVLEEGSHMAHVAIVARALDIPLAGRAEDITARVRPGDLVVVDGDHGEVHLRPGADIVESYDAKIALQEQRQAEYLALKDTPSVTLDGTAVTLNVNAGLLVDLPHLDETGAAGIGLFRTELQFMISVTMPKVSAQTALYKQVLDAAGERPVVFRTLDLGGDKVLPYGRTPQEENPALGWRAVRITLDRPALLRYQIRALVKAAGGRPLNVMFPMIAEVSEFRDAKALVERELERLARMKEPLPDPIRVGTMLEVPALAWQIDALLPEVDFVSVGSNDLLQFLFAADRANPRCAERYDSLSPTVLAVLRHVAARAKAHGVPVALCGEMAGRPLDAMALIGLGFRAISMPPAAVGPVKQMVRSLHLPDLERFMEDLYDRPDHSLRGALADFAGAHGIKV